MTVTNIFVIYKIPFFGFVIIVIFYLFKILKTIEHNNYYKWIIQFTKRL
jgi:hypothetical protein